MSSYPEINIARRLIERYSLKPPVDIDALCREYANVHLGRFDLDIDGATFDLKPRAGKRPDIVINSNRSQNRIRFTLAHELGHVLIPTHFGDVVDENIAKSSSHEDNEANRFAAELLMPQKWLIECVQKHTDNPQALVSAVSGQAKVSIAAAAFRVINHMPAGFIFAQLGPDNRVIYCGRSPNTLTTPPYDEVIEKPTSFYQLAERSWQTDYFEGNIFVWWKIQKAIVPGTYDHRDWKLVLAEIVRDLSKLGHDRVKANATINGVMGYVNGEFKQNKSEQEIADGIMQRFHSKAKSDPIYGELYKDLLKHPQLHSLVANRVRALFLKDSV